MDFDLNEEQRLLKESIDGLLTDSYDFESRKKYMKEKGGWSQAVWGKLAEQGLLGLPFSEEDGGFGAGPIETMIVMEALGRNLVVEPYLDTVVLLGSLSAAYEGADRLAYGAGAALASFAWFFGLGYGARLLAPVFARPAAWRVLDVLIGCVMSMLALGLVVSFLRAG